MVPLLEDVPKQRERSRRWLQARERSLALRTYRAALRRNAASLTVHTAALSACTLVPAVDTRGVDFGIALQVRV